MRTEEELYKGCSRGDDSVRHEVFDRYLPLMHALCLRYAGSHADAEDLVQEGFIKIFSKIESFTWKGSGSFVSWMKTIFINSAINDYKRKTKDIVSCVENAESLGDEASEEEADSIIDKALDVFSEQDILEAISQLPEQFRVVFNLFAVEGLKHKQIATMLDIPLKTSTTRYLRAKSKLKVILSAKLQEKMLLQD